MALALIHFLDLKNGTARFRVDSGTNPYYNVQVGKGIYMDQEFERIDGVAAETGLRRNRQSDTLLDTEFVVTLPAEWFSKDDCFVQLQTYKDSSLRSPAYSKVAKIRVPDQRLHQLLEEHTFSTAQNSIPMYEEPLHPHRNIPYLTLPSPQGTPQLQNDWIRQLISKVYPLVMGNLQGRVSKGRRNERHLRHMITMLNTIINVACNGWNSQSLPDSKEHSGAISMSSQYKTRFVPVRTFSNEGPSQNDVPPMPALIDDSEMIKNILDQMQKEELLRMLLENQPAGGGIDINQLVQLLQPGASAGMPAKAAPTVPQRLPATEPAKAAPAVNLPGPANTGTVANTPTPQGAQPGSGQGTQTVATQKSLSLKGYPYMLSTQAVLSFDSAATITVNDIARIVFKRQNVKFRCKMNAPGADTGQTLQKSIISFSISDASGKVLLEKTFKRKDLPINETQSFDFTEAEIQVLPESEPVSITAEMRWINPSGTTIKAFGAFTALFSDNYLPKTTLQQLPAEQELVSMERYRAFWNKIWESPLAKPTTMNAANKKFWSLDVDFRYTVLLTPQKQSNGLMETRMSLNPQQDSELTDRTEGKMKSGIELSFSELNKLNTLWDKPPLSDAQLAAVCKITALTEGGSDAVSHIKLKGKMQVRGMVWVVPVFCSRDLVLSKITTVDDNGQVTEVSDVNVSFPVPSSVRIICLKSN